MLKSKPIISIFSVLFGLVWFGLVISKPFWRLACYICPYFCFTGTGLMLCLAWGQCQKYFETIAFNNQQKTRQCGNLFIILGIIIPYVSIIHQQCQTHLNHHYIDVIMGAIACQITSLAIVFSTVYQTQIKENIKVPRHWPLCILHRPRWIPGTNGQ